MFHKLLLNFTWWVNRKDPQGKNVFEGGFLGLDNIGVFDRSRPLGPGSYIEQSDGTSWMAMFCLDMLSMAMELAREDPAYEDVASKFFEHFVYISAAMNDYGWPRHRAVGRERRLLLRRPAPWRDRRNDSDESALDGWTHPAFCGRDVRSRRPTHATPLSSAAWIGSFGIIRDAADHVDMSQVTPKRPATAADYRQPSEAGAYLPLCVRRE